MLGLADEIDTAIAEAVKGLRAYSYSWAEIVLASASPARPPSSDGERHPDRAVIMPKLDGRLHRPCGSKRRRSATASQSRA
jgi:hypothetical protein